MSKLGKTLAIISIIFLASAGGALGQGKLDTSSGAFLGVNVTTSHSAVLAAFLSSISDEDGSTVSDTAISVSNGTGTEPYAGPENNPVGAAGGGFGGGGDTTGPVTFILYNRNGSICEFSTDSDPSVGTGVDEAGNLSPGQTYTVLANEIIETCLAVAGSGGFEFNGFAWIVGAFDAIFGTATVVLPAAGFTQSLALQPALGGIQFSPPTGDN